MSCPPLPGTFRLLDGWVGWDVLDAFGLSGLDGTDGVTLALDDPRAVDPNALFPYLPPPWIAAGCAPCEWLLVTPAPDPRLLDRVLIANGADGCSIGWRVVMGAGRCRRGLRRPVAVASNGARVAVSDRGDNTVWILTRGLIVGDAHVDRPGALAIGPGGRVWVSCGDGTSIVLLGPSGEPLGTFAARAPAPIEALRIADDGAAWIRVTDSAGGTVIYRGTKSGWTVATIADLRSAFAPSGLVAVSPLGFCVRDPGELGVPVTRCFDRYGNALSESAIPASSPPHRQTRGQLLTVAIDSGIARCVWHRVRLDVDVPTGTNIEVSIATSESATLTGGAAARGNVVTGDWSGFPVGVPHPDDWQPVTQGATDFLVQQPPGRYAFLRFRFSGDGTATPTLRRARLDFPRATSAEHLPSVYLRPPEAEDFTERFVSLFDATIDDIDAAIAQFPAILDSATTPDAVLPWLAGFLDVVFDPAWDLSRRRALLRAAPDLYRRRGTVSGLSDTIAIIAGAAPAIDELANTRAYGAAGTGRIGGVRLFSRAKARFALDASALGEAPVNSYGDPALDALTALAYRIRVSLPGNATLAGARGQAQLERLVEQQKPAHVVATVRVGGGLLLVGGAAVGVDTAFGPLSAPVLGANGSVRLGRSSVLAPGARGGRRAAIGSSTTIGVGMVLQ